MDLTESNTHSFIVKVWLEEGAKAGQVTWRGHITHVPGGEQRYLRDLDDITTFIAAYLERMGLRLGIRWRIRQWLKRFL
jgi:hypothetical protein